MVTQNDMNKKIQIPEELKYRSIKNLVFMFRPGFGNHVLNDSGAQIWNWIKTSSYSIRDMIGFLTTGLPSQATEEINRRENGVLDFINRLHSLGLIAFEGDSNRDFNDFSPASEKRPADAESDDATDGMDDIFKRGYEQNIPIIVDLNITDECNLRCLHCYAPLNDPASAPKPAATCRKPFNLEEYKELLRQLANMGTFYLTLTGGEIFTHPHFLDIYKYAFDHHFAIRLVSNGTLLKPEIADELQKMKPRMINISLHGARPETHDEVTAVKGSFNRTVNALKMLKERDLNVSIIHVVTKLDIAEAKAVDQLANTLGIPRSTTPLICPTAEGELKPLKLRISDADMRQLMRDGLYRPQRDVCTAAKRCTISSYGDVSPCLFLQNVIVGNLRENSFEEIWHSENMRRTRESADYLPPAECVACESFQYCPRCPALAFAEDGDYRKPSTEACRISAIYKSTLKEKGVPNHE
ncbi:MAG: radical SAM/SPASM domain-containing protein [Candidatus Omnitrophota bacterium]